MPLSPVHSDTLREALALEKEQHRGRSLFSLVPGRGLLGVLHPQALLAREVQRRRDVSPDALKRLFRRIAVAVQLKVALDLHRPRSLVLQHPLRTHSLSLSLTHSHSHTRTLSIPLALCSTTAALGCRDGRGLEKGQLGRRLTTGMRPGSGIRPPSAALCLPQDKTHAALACAGAVRHILLVIQLARLCALCVR